MNLHLRKPAFHDYSEIATWVPDALACKWWAGDAMPFPFLPAELPTLLDIGYRTSFCLMMGEKLVGFAQYGLRTLSAVHLSRVIVSSEMRGSGLGSLLCWMILKEAFAETSASVCTLRVYRKNERAIAIYRKLGFTPLEMGSNHDVFFMQLDRNDLTQLAPRGPKDIIGS